MRVGGTFLSRVYPRKRGDWKVAKTRRRESLRYVIMGEALTRSNHQHGFF